MMNILVAERIKELMDERKLNQVKLALELDICQTTISKWLLGKTEPSISSLWRLADFFGTDLDYLVGRKDF